ncbi:MAG: glutamine amidotransferase [Patescibacteria group bacterium]
MNIYGDQGNVIALQKRCEWRGIEFEIKKISIYENADELKKCDLFFFGGGQDRQQVLVAEDLQKTTRGFFSPTMYYNDKKTFLKINQKKEKITSKLLEKMVEDQNDAVSKGQVLKEMLKSGTPLLSICGGFQLLGKSYNFEGKTLPGINFFDVDTKAGKTRFINNILVECKAFALQSSYNQSGVQNESFATLVGFENHSGRTYLTEPTKPLGYVIFGHGNNGEDKTEGAIKFNAIGTYLHGSLLPKNPHLADWLIKKALEKKYDKKIDLPPLDDKLEWQAHNMAIKALF